MTDHPPHTVNDDIPDPLADFDLADHCFMFHEVFEDDLKMIQAYLDYIDEQCEEQYKSAYSHWRNLLRDLRYGVARLQNHTSLTNNSAFHESLRAFSFSSTTRFLSDIAHICGIKTERSWPDRFQANILLIMQAYQDLPYGGSQTSST